MNEPLSLMSVVEIVKERIRFVTANKESIDARNPSPNDRISLSVLSVRRRFVSSAAARAFLLDSRADKLSLLLLSRSFSA